MAGQRLRALVFGSLFAFVAVCNAQAVDPEALSASGPDQKRIALVIGNAAYESAPLRNPVNDARAMSATLKALGFDVALLEDASQKAMKRAIDEFGDRLQQAGKNTVGLFYYSGHGMQVNGRNYLVPVGANVRSERQVEYESVDAGRALAAMEDAGNILNIVILDACRDNPFARSSRNTGGGLAMMDAASGTLIAYATAPGRVADDGVRANGLYTEQLVRHMRTPGLKVEEVFKRVRADVERLSNQAQVPWESSSLKGDFYFAGKLASLADASGVSVDDQEVLWRAIESSDNPQDFEDYLARYPEGRFALAARSKARQARDRALLEPPSFLSTLSVNSTPPGAQVLLDGRHRGQTPLDITRIQPARYVVELRLAGHRPWREEVVLRGGQHVSLNESLDRYTLAMLDATNLETSVEIYLNGFFRGKGGGIIEDVEPGDYDVEVRRPRARPWKSTVHLRTGEIEPLVYAPAEPYRVGVFPGHLIGQYINYVDTAFGTRTSAEWGLLGVHYALAREPALQVVFSNYDGFSAPKQDIPEIRKKTWKGWIARELNLDFLRSKGREMGLDAIVALGMVVSGEVGPIEVYVYDPQRDQLYQTKGNWRRGNMTEQVTDVTQAALDQFFNVRAARP